MPSVSVIMPFYNTPLPFLAEAVESVRAQSYDDWELLLVDDGSDDEHSATARRLLAAHESRMRYLTHPGHENLGISATRNLGLRHAKGYYVAFLDSDDVWLPNKLTEQVELLERHPEAAMLYGNTLYWYNWSRDPIARDLIPELGVPANRLVAPPDLLPKFLSGAASVPCPCSVIYRREALEAVGGCVESFRSLYEDQALFAKVCLAFPVYVSDRCWDRYRQHPASSTWTEDGRHAEYRRYYLNWLEQYLGAQDIHDDAVWATLRNEQSLLHDPTGFHWRRLGKTLRGRWGKLHRRVRGWLGFTVEP